MKQDSNRSFKRRIVLLIVAIIMALAIILFFQAYQTI